MRPIVGLVRELARTSRALLAAAAGLIVAEPMVRAVMALLSGAIFAAVPGAVRSGVHSDAARSLVLRLALYALAYVLNQLVTGTMIPVAAMLGRRLDASLRQRVLTAVAEVPGIAHLEDPVLLDLVDQGRRVGPGHQTPGDAADGLVWIASRYAVVAVGVVMVGSFRWWLLLVLVPALWWSGMTIRKHINVTIDVSMGQTRTLRRSRYLADLALAPASAKELRLFGLGEWLRDRYTRTWLSAMEPVWRARGASRRRLIAPIVVQGAATALLFTVMTRAAIDGEIGVGRLGTLFVASGMLWGLTAMSNADVSLAYGLVAMPAIVELERTACRIRESMAGDLSAAGMPASSIRFEGVSFSYAGTTKAVLDDLDLELRAGESLAVVGGNGAGKTTLVKLLARFYDPAAGRITIDGVDLRDLDAVSWQQRIAAIFQDFTRYELSARENIGLGAPTLRNDDAALENAARRAGVLDLIESLPNGWDTVLSRQVEGGVELSGGEWQRLALARALLAVDAGAGVLVLDEPTANLDARAESALYEQFLSLTHGVTTIVISHRFSTVRRADRIVVLRGGKVVESGTHDELLALGGRYARMFRLQAARFTETTPAGA